MKEYEIFKFDDDINKDVVLITSTEDLYYLQENIYDELSKLNGENFSVLIDLFLRNGFSFNRFVSLHFKNKNNCKSLIVNPRDVSDDIKLEIRDYLKSNTSILEGSALTQKIINFVKSM